jgi:hypothetical protein
MGLWTMGIMVVLLLGSVTVSAMSRAHRRKTLATKRRVEAPNSHYSSLGVRHQEDRERWRGIDLGRLHPLNQEEVERLLGRVEANGVQALSPKDRLFLDNMTLPRAG